MFFQRLLLTALVVASCTPNSRFMERSVSSGGRDYRYRVWLPARYTKLHHWPIVLYLHVHQPYRVRPYTIFETGTDHNYFLGDYDSRESNERKPAAEVSARMTTGAVLTWVWTRKEPMPRAATRATSEPAATRAQSKRNRPVARISM